MGTSEHIADQVRRALIAAAKTMPIVVVMDATGCSVHGPQQQVACAFVVLCPDPSSPTCWPSARDGGDAAASADATAQGDAAVAEGPASR